MTQATERFTAEHSIETAASPETIWAAFADVRGWTRWNAGIERIEFEGPFVVGAAMTMQPPGQEPIRSTLIEVRPNEGFTDETRVGDLVVTVGHRIARVDAARTVVTFAVEAVGPKAREIGPLISADFPAVLAALTAHVEARS